MKNFNIISFFILSSKTMGGDTRITTMLARSLSMNKRFKVNVYTTLEGEMVFRKAGVINAKYSIIKSKNNPLSFLGHIKYSFECYKFLVSNKINSQDIYWGRSHFWPEVIPLYVLKKRNHVKLISSMYLFYPYPWKGFLHSYDRQVVIPKIGEIWKFIYNRVSFLLMKNSNLFLITNDSDRIHFPKKDSKKILSIYGGVDFKEIKDKSEKKYYEGIFVGRIHEQKGIEYLIKIWKEVTREFPNAQLAIVGVGDRNYLLKMKNLAKELRVDKNIDWQGYVNGKEKYVLLKRSKVFLHTTVYDNNGMAAAEALSVGVPVVRFDLPPLKKVYENGCLVSERNNVKDFAHKVSLLLNDKKLYTKLSGEALAVGKSWSWDIKSKQFINFLKINGIS